MYAIFPINPNNVLLKQACELMPELKGPFKTKEEAEAAIAKLKPSFRT